MPSLLSKYRKKRESSADDRGSSHRKGQSDSSYESSIQSPAASSSSRGLNSPFMGDEKKGPRSPPKKTSQTGLSATTGNAQGLGPASGPSNGASGPSGGPLPHGAHTQPAGTRNAPNTHAHGPGASSAGAPAGAPGAPNSTSPRGPPNHTTPGTPSQVPPQSSSRGTPNTPAQALPVKGDRIERFSPKQDRNDPWAEWQIRRACPSARFGHSANNVAARDGELLIMGGIREMDILDDLWIIDTNSLSGYQVKTEGPYVGPRVGHAALTLGNAYIMIGGDTKIKESDPLDDNLYLLNTSTFKWTVAEPVGPRPCGRYGHSICNLGVKIYVFGGQVDDVFFDDMWMFDLNNLRPPNARWEKIEPVTPPPPPRTNHSVVTYNDKMYLFGGANGDLWYSDTWCFDSKTNRWTQLECTGYVPAPCQGHAATIVDDVMYVFGGMSSQGLLIGQLFALKLTTCKWYTFQNLGAGPSPRSGHSLTAFDNDKILVWGGTDQSNTAFVLDVSRISYPPDDEADASFDSHGDSVNAANVSGGSHQGSHHDSALAGAAGAGAVGAGAAAVHGHERDSAATVVAETNTQKQQDTYERSTPAARNSVIYSRTSWSPQRRSRLSQYESAESLHQVEPHPADIPQGVQEADVESPRGAQPDHSYDQSADFNRSLERDRIARDRPDLSHVLSEGDPNQSYNGNHDVSASETDTGAHNSKLPGIAGVAGAAGLAGAGLGAVGAHAHNMQNSSQGLGSKLQGVPDDLQNSSQGFAAHLPDSVQGGLQGAQNQVPGGFSGAQDKVAGGISGAHGKVAGSIGALQSKSGEGVDSVQHQVTSGIDSAHDKLPSGLKDKVPGSGDVQGQMTNAQNKFQGAIPDSINRPIQGLSHKGSQDLPTDSRAPGTPDIGAGSESNPTSPGGIAGAVAGAAGALGALGAGLFRKSTVGSNTASPNTSRGPEGVVSDDMPGAWTPSRNDPDSPDGQTGSLSRDPSARSDQSNHVTQNTLDRLNNYDNSYEEAANDKSYKNNRIDVDSPLEDRSLDDGSARPIAGDTSATHLLNEASGDSQTSDNVPGRLSANVSRTSSNSRTPFEVQTSTPRRFHSPEQPKPDSQAMMGAVAGVGAAGAAVLASKKDTGSSHYADSTYSQTPYGSAPGSIPGSAISSAPGTGVHSAADYQHSYPPGRTSGTSSPVQGSPSLSPRNFPRSSEGASVSSPTTSRSAGPASGPSGLGSFDAHNVDTASPTQVGTSGNSRPDKEELKSLEKEFAQIKQSMRRQAEEASQRIHQLEAERDSALKKLAAAGAAGAGAGAVGGAVADRSLDSDYKQKHATTARELQSVKDEHDNLLHEHTKLKAKHADLTENHDYLNTSMDQHMQALDAVNKALEHSRITAQNAQNDADLYKEENKRLKEQVAELERKVAESSHHAERNADLESQVSTLRDAHESSSVALNQHLTQLVGHWNTHNERQSTATQSRSLPDDNEHYSSMYEKSRSAHASTQRDLEAAHAELAQLRQQQQQQPDHASELEKLRGEHGDYVRQLHATHESNVRDIHSQYQGQHSSLQKKYEELEQDYSGALEHFKSQRLALEKTRDELNRTKDTNSKLQEEIQDIKLQLQDPDASTTSTTSNRHAEVMVRGLKARIIILEEERDELRQKVEKLKEAALAGQF